MNITILGAGNIGKTIGRQWQQRDHAVTYGVRNPGDERYRDLANSAKVDEISRAIQSADAILFAVPGDAIDKLLENYGGVLDGKLLLDASNRMGGGSFHQLPLFETIVPNARLYRAFNTLGWENFAEPIIDGERADLFFSGPQTDERAVVERLIADVGLRPVYVGHGVEGANLLDGVTRLWFTLAIAQGHGRQTAFRVLRSTST